MSKWVNVPTKGCVISLDRVVGFFDNPDIVFKRVFYDQGDKTVCFKFDRSRIDEMADYDSILRACELRS